MIEMGAEINGELRIRQTPDEDDLIRQKLMNHKKHPYLPIVYDPDPVYDPDTHHIRLSGLYTIGPSDITRHKELVEYTAEDKKQIADAKQKTGDYIANLPSWAQVENNINNITNLAGAKAVLMKLARVVYWDIKNDSE